MPDVVYYVAASLDGFIATPDGGVEWLSPFQIAGEDYGYEAFASSIDCALMGRKTYEQVLGFGDWVYGETPCYVFSRTQREPVAPSITTTDRSPRDVLAEMEARGLKRAWLVGGTALASSFRDEGWISEWILSIMPVILGQGIPLFSGTGPSESLKLMGSTSYPNGVVQLRYTRGESP